MVKHTIDLSFTSNIKPSFYNFKKDKNKLLNTEIFLFLATLSFILNKKINNEFKKKIFFFIKPLKKKTITYLRAPYRYKLARNQVTFSRHYFIFRIVFYDHTNLLFKNIYSFIKYNSNFFLNIQKISTNLSNIVYIKHSYNINSFNLFKY